MTEAVSEVLQYGFNELELNRIEAKVDTRNTKSIRLLERMGFKREGFLRQRHYYGGTYQNELYYGLLRSDWEKK
jgi:RimJ/RimL family protein N-acetyltransferase